MKTLFQILFSFSLLLTGMLILAFNIQLAKAEPTVWTVDDDGPADFSSIQEAIDSSLVADGDTIFVHSGTYYEQVVVNKSVSLIGEEIIKPTVSNANKSTVYISADDVTVSGFVIQNSVDLGIFLNHSSNSVINENIVEAVYGILVEGGSGNKISDNEVSALQGCVMVGLDLTDSSNNVVTGNYFSGECHYAFTLYNSSHNYVAFNYIAAHFNADLLKLWQSSNNLIVDNTFEPFYMAAVAGNIEFHESNGNVFYHNNFLIWNPDRIWIDDVSLNNTWDNGYPSGGNYWSNYPGVDVKSGPNQDQLGSDGIGDTPYIIDANNPDHYPLMGPINFFNTITWNETTYYVHTVSNSTISDFYFSQSDKLISFNVTGPDATVGFCRVTIPKQLLWVDSPEQWIVLVDAQLPLILRLIENTDYTYIYFVYSHSTREVLIIGIYVIGPPPPEYTLTIYSSPTGVTFTVGDVSRTTPWSGTYSEGTSISLVMPGTHIVGEARYYWDQWSDGVTSRFKTVTMNSNITLTAHYTGPYYQLTVTSSPITGIQFSINGVSRTTPYTEWLLEGYYTLEMPETHNGYVWSHWLEDGDTNRIKTITLQGTTWTAVYTLAPVGGKATPINIPINKPETPTLWIWLTTIIFSLILAAVYFKKRKRNTKMLVYTKC